MSRKKPFIEAQEAHVLIGHPSPLTDDCQMGSPYRSAKSEEPTLLRYCVDCKWLTSNSPWGEREVCSHPDNWMDTYSHRVYGAEAPRTLNRNNNCNWFEIKTKRQRQKKSCIELLRPLPALLVGALFAGGITVWIITLIASR